MAVRQNKKSLYKRTDFDFFIESEQIPYAGITRIRF